jgi:hypothetical protein
LSNDLGIDDGRKGFGHAPLKCEAAPGEAYQGDPADHG